MPDFMLKYAQTLLVILTLSPEFCTLNATQKTIEETLTNYNETCDIIDKIPTCCPSKKSVIGAKICLMKSIYDVKVVCDPSDSNAINYLTYLPNMGDMHDLHIVNCTALKEPNTITKFFRKAYVFKLTIFKDFGVKLTAEHFRGLKNLKSLQIIDSNLTALEADCFYNLRSLEILFLTWNKLTQLPTYVFRNTKKLMELNMKQNRLQHLPESIFKELHALLILNLYKNALEALPDNIFRDTAALRTLNLGYNKLTAINEKLFATLTTLEYLVLSDNQLLSVHSNAFSQMPRLIELRLNKNNIELQPPNYNFIFPKALKILRLSSNAITNFNISWFTACKSLFYINMSHNSIASVQADDLFNLTNPELIIDLSHNSIREMKFPLKDYNGAKLSDKHVIHLSQNPWQCNCQSKSFLLFVKNNAKIIADFKKMRCEDTRLSKNISELETSDICPPDQIFIMSLITIACISALVGILLGLYYKYDQEITIWLYARNICLRFITETELDRNKIYDAFISYSSNDLRFIADHLQPQLEHGPTPFRLCIHERDWLVGEVIADQIMRSIELSRRTIIVLSQNFITSSWSLMEFRAAHQAALKEGRVRVIIILYGEINDMELLDPLLKSYLRMHTYLEWGDPWFWEKLRNAMPHPRRRGADVRRNFDDMELNRVN